MNRNLLSQMVDQIASPFQSFKRPQIKRIARHSLGLLVSDHCHLAKIAATMAPHRFTKAKPDSIVRALQRTLADEKLDPAEISRCLTRMVVDAYSEALRSQEFIPLIVDESTFSHNGRFMGLGMGFQSRAFLLAAKAYIGGKKKAYPSGGQVKLILELVKTILPELPIHIPKLVIADRGIGNSPRLCKALAKLALFYLMRLPNNVKMIIDGEKILPIEQVAPGERWEGEGIVFVNRGKVPARVIVIWDKGQKEPWILITNHPTVTGREYAIRNWIEQTFRDLKKNGWHAMESGIGCPERATRLLAIMMVAYAYRMSIGSWLFAKTKFARICRRGAGGKPKRKNSLFKESKRWIDNELLFKRKRLPEFKFYPDPFAC